MMIRTIRRTLGIFTAIALTVGAGEVMAQMPRGGGAFGDWRVSVDYDGRSMDSILSLSRDQDGNRTGQWISFWGANDLKDVQFEDGKLSFSWSVEGFQGDTFTSKFSGTIEDGTLTGTLSGDRGEFPVKGERVPRVARAAGTWDLHFTVGEQDVNAKLKVTQKDDGTLAGEWISDWGEHQITSISANRNELTFARTSTFDGREMKSTFTGTMERDGTLTGTLSSDMGDMQVTGTQEGSNVAGTWMLDIESDRGPRKQRLRINRDLSALYGSIQVDEVNVDGDRISVPMEMEFGDRTWSMTLAGTVDGNSLTGELTTERGTRSVTGTRMVRGPRGPR